LRYGANNPERRQMQVIAQSPGQVTLLLFFDGLFCRFMLIFRTGINFTATAITRSFPSTLDLDLHLRVDHPSALRCPYLSTG
jgi:hypothetical protein